MKHIYGIVFSNRNIGGNGRSLPPFQVRDEVMERRYRKILEPAVENKFPS